MLGRRLLFGYFVMRAAVGALLFLAWFAAVLTLGQCIDRAPIKAEAEPAVTVVDMKRRTSCKVWPAPMYSNQAGRKECAPLATITWRN